MDSELLVVVRPYKETRGEEAEAAAASGEREEGLLAAASSGDLTRPLPLYAFRCVSEAFLGPPVVPTFTVSFLGGDVVPLLKLTTRKVGTLILTSPQDRNICIQQTTRKMNRALPRAPLPPFPGTWGAHLSANLSDSNKTQNEASGWRWGWA